METRCQQQPSASMHSIMSMEDNAACCSNTMRLKHRTHDPKRSQQEFNGKSSPAVLGSRIYFESNSDASEEDRQISKSMSMSTGFRLGQLDRVYVDTCDIPGMGSSRINNSMDSPATSSSILSPIIPDWRTHRQLNERMTSDQSGLKSGGMSQPLNNYDDSDIMLTNGRESNSTGSNVSPWDLSLWEGPSKSKKKSLKFKDTGTQLRKRADNTFMGSAEVDRATSKEKTSVISEELQDAKGNLVETLEAVIALLSVTVEERSLETPPLENDQRMVAYERSSPEIGYTSTISTPHSEEHIAVQSDDLHQNSPSPEWDFPTPCEMRSTYNEPAISPMEITEDARSCEKPLKAQTVAGSLKPSSETVAVRQRRVRDSNSRSRIRNALIRRGRSSQTSLAREPSSASVSDWDVREADIEVKQPQACSESDEAFEEFVRNQERRFPPPSRPEVWDPLQAPTSWRQYNEISAPRQWTAPVLLEDDSYSVTGDLPSTHEMGVQVNSIELEAQPKKPLFGKLLHRTSSGFGGKCRAIVKNRKMRSWLWKKKRDVFTPNAPAPSARVTSCDNCTRSTEGPSPRQSETAVTMITVASQDCGWPTSHLRRLIPKRFTEDPLKTLDSRPSTGESNRLSTYGDFFYVESGTSLGDFHRNQSRPRRGRNGPEASEYEIERLCAQIGLRDSPSPRSST